MSASNVSGKNTSDKKALNPVHIALIFAFVLAGAVLLWAILQPAPPVANDDGYYTGVRYNHRTGKWVDVNGKISSPPPGQAIPAQPATSASMINE
jgi:hypothetical protein